MNYFITDQGLQPFDLNAQDLIYVLRNNIVSGDEGYHRKGRTRTAHTSRHVKIEDVMRRLETAVREMMEKPYCLFKHPDMSIQSLRKSVDYKPNKNDAAFDIDESDMFEILNDHGQLTVITSFTEEINPVFDFSLQMVLVSKTIFESWLRNMFIDEVLVDL